MGSDPDLFAELDAAEAIVMGRTEAVQVQWGSRDESGKEFIYGSNAIALPEASARAAVASRARHGCRDVLLRRTITYSPWEEVPEVSCDVREDEGP